MKGSPIKTTILSARIIANVDRGLLAALQADKPDIRSIGIITTDCDDVSYAALDEATKKARVSVIYARSMYAGSANASTALAGEFIGILAGPDPEEVRSGLQAAESYINSAGFVNANEEGSIVYFAQCISRTGSYLSQLAEVPEGTAMAYLIAPPLEATLGLDAALKAAQVEMRVYYGPPSETNFAGGLLVGDQAACLAACQAFANMVCEVAAAPLVY